MTDWYEPDPNAGTLARSSPTPPSPIDIFKAGWQQYDAVDLSTTRNYHAGKISREAVAALARKGKKGFVGANGQYVPYDPDTLRTDYFLHQASAPRLIADVLAERQRDPNFLKDVIDDDGQIDPAIIAMRRREYAEAQGVLSQGVGLTDSAAGFAGAIGASFADPLQLGIMAATAPIGGAGVSLASKLFGGALTRTTARKIAITALSEGSVNALATVPTLPMKADHAAEIGLDYKPADAGFDVAVAFGAGALLGGAGATAAHSFSTRRLARELRGLDRPLTPAEADALPVLEQAARDIAASPFVPTPEGDAAHTTRLTEAVTALESDRPMNPAVFETPTPAVKPTPDVTIAADPLFDPTPHLEAARAYVADRKAGKLTPEAMGRALGLAPDEASAVLSRLASGEKGAGLRQQPITRRIKGSGVRELVGVKWVRTSQRQGFVDLITQLADAGGIVDDAGHDLRGTIGNKLISGAGMVFRTKGGMSLDDVGEFLLENGWVQPNKIGNGAPTEAEVIDIIDRALREKMYHPEEAALVMEADARRAGDQEWQARADEVRAGYDRMLAERPGVLQLPLTEDDVAAIIPTLDRHTSVADAIFEHWDRLGREAETEAAAIGDDAGFDDYADFVPFDEADYEQFTRTTGEAGQDSGGSAAASGDAREGAAGGGGPENEAFNTAASEQALEAFDTPQGEGPAAQVEALQHDLKAEVEAEADDMAAADQIDSWSAAQSAMEDAADAEAMRTGKETSIDTEDATIEEIARVIEAGGDVEAAVRKAIKDGRVKLTEGEAPPTAEVRPMQPSTVVPAPEKTVRVADYAGDYISPEDAAARLADWKAEVARIGQTPKDGKIVISLFDASGAISKPWREMGYEVYQLDIKLGDDLLRNMTDYTLAIEEMKAGGAEIVGVLAQPPCTTFAGSGARWWGPRHDKSWRNAVRRMWGDWAAKEFDSPLEYNRFLVAATEEYIAAAQPGFFVIENPVGRIEKMTGLPKPRLTFDPHHFGDPYTKRTNLYGEFNDQLPTANVDPVEGSRMHKLRSSAEKDGGLRSITSEPFAYALALANVPAADRAAAQAVPLSSPKEGTAIPVIDAPAAAADRQASYDAATVDPSNPKTAEYAAKFDAAVDSNTNLEPMAVPTDNPNLTALDLSDIVLIGYDGSGNQIWAQPNGYRLSRRIGDPVGRVNSFRTASMPLETTPPAAPVGDTATGSLGLDAAQDAPAGGMTERQRAEMQARLQQSQMRRGGQQSADQISGGLFDAARDQLDAFAMPDGSTVSRADLLAEFDADDAAIKTIKDCL
jgi:hypothetical protein